MNSELILFNLSYYTVIIRRINTILLPFFFRSIERAMKSREIEPK